MTGLMSFSPKKAYFRCEDNTFSSSFVSFSFSNLPNSSGLLFCVEIFKELSFLWMFNISLRYCSSWKSNWSVKILSKDEVLDNIFCLSKQTSSRVSIFKHSLESNECFIASSTSKCTSSFCTLNFSLQLSTSIITFAVFMNGLPGIRDTSMSSSISMTTKSTGNVNLSTITRTSSTTPYGYLMDLSAS
ncbi:hypothetical protein Fmac_025161 [Flemingia macrophylla]|uniref:Uncharacterized protein n=1 Tax=Flemingia macrophylla TaxID=520843 RepID=A0ABD1LS10_9FABA